MTLPKQGNFTFNHVDQQDDLYKVKSALEIKQALDSRGNELKTTFNNLIDALNATTSGNSGAKNISVSTISNVTGNDVQTILEFMATLFNVGGASKVKINPISGLASTTVQNALEDVNNKVNQAVVGQLPDGSIPESKLAFSPATDQELAQVQTGLNASISTSVTNAKNELEKLYWMGGM